MLNRKYRPATFDQIGGQRVPKKVLSAIVKDPAGKPAILLFEGQYGTGKSTAARVFGRALNCSSTFNRPCLACQSCKDFNVRGDSVYYKEYDSTVVGNVAMVRSLKEAWAFPPSSGYRVIVFDECQSISPEAQNALLDFTESPPERTFFIFATTDKDKLVKPLVSRSFVLTFHTLVSEEVEEIISRTMLAEGKEVPDDIVKLIIRRAGGHVRDALAYLELYFLLDREEFEEAVLVADKLFLELFKAAALGSTKDVQDVISKIAKVPLKIAVEDFQRFMEKVLDRVLLDGKPLFEGIGEEKVLKGLRLYSQMVNLVSKSTSDFCSFLIILASSLRKKTGSTTPALENSRFKKNFT